MTLARLKGKPSQLGDLPLLLISFTSLILNMIIGDVFGIAFSLALLAYILVNMLLPTFSQLLLKAGLVGIDLHKQGKINDNSNNANSSISNNSNDNSNAKDNNTDKNENINNHKNEKDGKILIPSCLGLLGGLVYLAILSTFIPFPFFRANKSSFLEKSLGLSDGERLGGYTAAIASIGQMILLGFVDDVLGLKWRHKIILPAIASLPLLTLYRLTNGITFVVVPKIVKSILRLKGDNNLVELGIFYYIYMSMMAVFCTHSINILAGVNGVEVGQTIVIAASVIIHSLLTLYKIRGGGGTEMEMGKGEIYHGSSENFNGNGMGIMTKGIEYHFFSLYLLFPFLAISLALWRWNRYPARIFVGDTFCYFAGMVFSVVGILGHFSKTMMLFFIPQTLNFLYSAPQLFGMFPCPRHRLPDYDEELDLIKASMFKIKMNKRTFKYLRILSILKIIFIQEIEIKENKMENIQEIITRENDEKEGENDSNRNGEKEEGEKFIMINNLTILNWILSVCGPMKESNLTNIILVFQIICSSVALLIRHQLTGLIFSI